MKSGKDVFKRRQKTIPLLRERFNHHVYHCFAVATPHGFVHLVRPQRTIFEKIFWLVCIILAAIPCVIISRQAWNRYSNSPTVNTLLRDHQQWLHTFPALTLCSADIGDKEGVYEFFRQRGYDIQMTPNDEEEEEEEEEDIEEELEGNSTTELTTTVKYDRIVDQTDVDKFVEALFLGDFSTYGELKKYRDIFNLISPKDYLDLNIITTVRWDIFEKFNDFASDLTVTEFGVCFSFNSILANYSSPTRYRNNDMSIQDNYQIVEVLPIEEDAYMFISVLATATKVFIHSFNEMIGYGDKYHLIEEHISMDARFTAEKKITSQEVKNLQISQRHCRYLDESNLKYFPVYSHGLCLQECRMKFALKYCKCFPFYYRPLYGETVCDIDGMVCLSKYEREFANIADGHTNVSLCEHCEPKCEDEVIILTHNGIVEWIFDSQMMIIYVLTTRTRIQLVTIYTETDFLVQIGSLAGLAYGIGLLSVIEVLYLLTMRFYFAVFRGRTLKLSI